MLLFLYIFLLFVIITPGFIFKSKPSFKIYLLHSVLYSLLLYLTYDLVKGKNIEGNGYNIEIEGASTITEFLRQLFGRSQQPIHIDVNNHLATVQDPNVSNLPDLPQENEESENTE